MFTGCPCVHLCICESVRSSICKREIYSIGALGDKKNRLDFEIKNWKVKVMTLTKPNMVKTAKAYAPTAGRRVLSVVDILSDRLSVCLSAILVYG